MDTFSGATLARAPRPSSASACSPRRRRRHRHRRRPRRRASLMTAAVEPSFSVLGSMLDLRSLVVRIPLHAEPGPLFSTYLYPLYTTSARQ
eukprot:scaffold90000_cov60-Phaeocystis_antarctica.AAC.1